MDTWVEQAIQSIAANNSSGAVELAGTAADVLLRCARTDSAETAEAFRFNILQAGQALIEAQPAMAPLVNLVNTVLWRLGTSNTLAEMRTIVDTVVRDFKRRLHMHETAVAEAALPLILDHVIVMTHSRSTTVRAALFHASRAQRRFQVVCSESRPIYEGRTLATELAEQGIKVTLVTDALAISRVAEADLVLFGADHLTNSGLANKVGTYGLVLAAQAAQVPVYALCSSTKFLPPGYPLPWQHRRPAEQVWPDTPENVTVENYYFDYSPLHAITGIVTERGVLPREVIEGWLAALQLHPDLHAPRVRTSGA
ncbi:MAG: initiation factor 2B [Chloroflexaceae bacterium]|nr:initiation factor 2B [Chloroflexaceae bacterium]